MVSYIVRRMVLAVLSVWGVLTIVFILVRILPGDPVKIMLGMYVSEELIAEQKRIMGLDQPLIKQYLVYLKQICTNNWGKSLLSQQPVTKLIWNAFPRTVVLSFFGLGIALWLALPLGIWAGVRANLLYSRLVVTFSLLGQSIAPFWLGIILILVFARWLKLLPSFGYGGIAHLVLPGLAVGLPLVGVLTRLIRSEVSQQLVQDYVKTARAKGLHERKVIIVHALRNSLVSITTIVGLQLGTLLAGAIVVETVFAWPGIGSLMIVALGSRDYPVIQIAVALTATAYVLLNLGTDILVGLLDPRIRYD